MSKADLDDLAYDEPAAAAAWSSLGAWHLPIVAGWTRDTATLREVQGDRALREGVEAVASEGGVIWVANLLATPFDAPLVVILPELDEAWSVRMSGVADVGQLSVLLSRALADPLGRLGSEPADDAVFDCMSGAGPQQVSASYQARFQLYPWEALDLESGLPKSGLHEWKAPGGFGNHSLPPDFWPGALDPIADGLRVVLAVRSGAPGTFNLTRILGGSRAFAALPARLTDARRLSDQATRSCREAVRMRVQLLRQRR